MQLNDLPEDCLLYIFDYFPELKQLHILSTVCSGWNNLIKRRLEKVQYLNLEESDEHSWHFKFREYPSHPHIYTNDIKLLERVNVSKLLPNLKFFTTNHYNGWQCMCRATINVLSTSNTLIGLKDRSPCHKSDSRNCSDGIHIDKIVQHCGNLEYLSSKSKHFIRSFFFSFGDNLKHFEALVDLSGFSLYPGATDSVSRLMAKMPNLETLTLLCEPEIKTRHWPIPKINLKQLKILTFYMRFRTFQVLSLFPELPSLYLRIDMLKKAKTFTTSDIHPSVQDLVIRIDNFLIDYQYDRDFKYPQLFKSILAKFPNCKNLMIDVAYEFINNKLMIEIIEVLPNLNLFVQNVYQALDDRKDPDYFNSVDRHFKTTGRRIAIYLFKNKGFGRIIRYSLNEDVAGPFKTDNQFIHKYFRCGKDSYPSIF
ncbi:uncharacterized protein LOC128387041 [Panonychus citri]|uniref:uncharacterized protein LOC128387041 n=1 Tax=Panonychus citri TaxID=50023 RepID=UPI0023076F9A|nr:uncharacterized protein LOC128387041 [Panonychus citri]